MPIKHKNKKLILWVMLLLLLSVCGYTYTIREQLIAHEGLRLRIYRDPAGTLTIGVGRNLEANGITETEAMVMLDTDLAEAITVLNSYPWWKRLNSARQRVLIDIVFNVGGERFKQFTKLIAACAQQDWKAASQEILHSKLALKRRSTLSQWMLSGVIPDAC